MPELERSLRALEPDWPATPDVAARLRLEPRRRRRALVVAVAAAGAAALAAALAVPESRGALLRFFHLGGATIERVDTLPAAEERPLAAGLGVPASEADAARVLRTPFLPRRHGTLYEQGGFVSTLLRAPAPVLLSEFGSPDLVKKFVTGAVEEVEIAAGVSGLWITGAPHVVFFPGSSPRLAGNVLVWARGEVTFRLEGRALRRDDAVRLARAVLGTGGA